MKIKTGIAAAAVAAGAGYFAARHWSQERSVIDLHGKLVLITGGSRGLGLALAREFGSQGATIAICARDQAEIERAQADLSARGLRSHTFICDVTIHKQVQSMIAELTDLPGPVDILVNNAGVIKVGPFSEMEIEDFDEALEVMFWGALHTTLAVVPAMRARGQGSVVNITSIGGKVSVPHLLPYSCAKFAAVALSEGLRTELAPEGIKVTTIVPGLMRTGSHLNAEFKGRQASEYAWFAAGAATPLISITAERAARSIVRATVRGEGEKILSAPADALARLHGIAPGIVGEILKIVNGMLPSGPTNSTAVRHGSTIERRLSSRLWKIITMPGNKAAKSLNEAAAS